QKEARVCIEQDGLSVRMIIETVAGDKEIIEETLREYGLIINGQLAPEKIFHNPYEVLALQNKLEIVGMELRHSQQLLAVTNAVSNDRSERILALEDQVKILSNAVADALG